MHVARDANSPMHVSYIVHTGRVPRTIVLNVKCIVGENTMRIHKKSFQDVLHKVNENSCIGDALYRGVPLYMIV
jgi:hypothetical protein